MFRPADPMLTYFTLDQPGHLLPCLSAPIRDRARAAAYRRHAADRRRRLRRAPEVRRRLTALTVAAADPRRDEPAPRRRPPSDALAPAPRSPRTWRSTHESRLLSSRSVPVALTLAARRRRLPAEGARRPRPRVGQRRGHRGPGVGAGRRPPARAARGRGRPRRRPARSSPRLDTTDAQLALRRATADRDQADAQLRLLEAGSRQEDIRQAEAQVEPRRGRRRRRRDRARRRRDGPAALRSAAARRTPARTSSATMRWRGATWRGRGCRRPQERVRAAQEGWRGSKAGAAPRGNRRGARPASRQPTPRSPPSSRTSSDATVVVAGRRHRHAEARRRRRDPRAAHADRDVTDLDHAWANVYVDEPLVPRLRARPGGHALHRRRRRGPEGHRHASSRRRRSSRRATCRRPTSARSWSTASRSSVDNAHGVLKQGMPVEAEIPLCGEVAPCRPGRHPRPGHEALRRDRRRRRPVARRSRRGEMFGLIGPDGAGKTTTIRLICGLLRADAGTIRVLGLDPVRAAPRRHAHRSATSRSASASTAT